MAEPLLTRATLMAALRALDEQLRREHVNADVFIFGGAAMVLGYNSRDATYDVDGIWSPHGAVQRAAHAVAKQQGLPQSWLNDEAVMYLPAGQKPEGQVVFETSALRVLRAEPELLLAMKVSAFRLGDHQDIEWLANHLGLTGADEIIALTEQVMHQPLPDNKKVRVQALFPSPIQRTDDPPGPTNNT